MQDPANSVYESSPRSLADLIREVRRSRSAPTSEELSALLEVVLTRPMEFRADGVTGGQKGGVRLGDAPRELLLKGIGDLLSHPHPPVDLLVMVKEFAKANCQHPDSAIAPEVARVLYFASIAAGLARCGCCMTNLEQSAQLKGLRWLSEQAWVDDGLRALGKEALASLGEEG